MIDFNQPPEVVAPQLLGAVLNHTTEQGTVSVMLTEVEAYPGEGDTASHTFNGPTPRCQTMFGPPAHLYVYASYGIHRAANLVCRPEGRGAGVLLRAGRIVGGRDLARARRGDKPEEAGLARGPGNLGAALGFDLQHNGLVLGSEQLSLAERTEPVKWVAGPRIGISKNKDVPLRFWIPDDRTVTSPRRAPRG